MAKETVKPDAVEETQVALLERVVEILTAKVEALEAKEPGASTIVEAAKPSYTQVPEKTFEYKKGTYRFLVSGTFHNNQIVKAEDALGDEALLKLFVETYPKTVEKINL